MSQWQMSVKSQLSCGFGLLAAAVLAVSLVAVKQLGDAQDRFEEHVQHVAMREKWAAGVRSAVFRRAIAARNLLLITDPAEREVEKQAVIKADENTTTRLAGLKDVLSRADDATERDRALVADIEKLEAAYGPVARDIVAKALNNEMAEATAKLIHECRPLLMALTNATDAYAAYMEERTADSVKASAERHARQRWLLLLASAVAIVASVAMAVMIVRSLLRALGAEPSALAAAARRVADGHLSPPAGGEHAPSGSVLASMMQMQARLAQVVTNVRSNAEGVATASAQIAGGNAELSSRTEQQAASLEETAASMEQLGGTVRLNAENALQANQLAMNASEVATKGGSVVGEVVETMKGINASSKKIAEIIAVIDGIAFQTNILALNAAVEAARAGQQGRGFAVVASEVRSLAQRSADAAREIKTLINDSVDRVDRGTALVDRAGTTMAEVVNSIRRVTDVVGEISAASTEQSTGMAQIGEAVTLMDQATQQNAALVEESAAAAESLKLQAQQLVQAVAVFKLDSSASASNPVPAPTSFP